MLQERQEKGEQDEETVDGFTVHRIQGTLHQKLVIASAKYGRTWKGVLAHFLCRLLGIRTLLLLPWYPMRTPMLCLRYAKKAEQLQQQLAFDMTVCCFSPLAALYAGERLKKKHAVPFVSYYVDTLTDNLKKKHFLTKRFMDSHGLKYEKRFFEASDLVLNLKCHEKNFEQTQYDPYRHKMQITDIPHMKDRATDYTPPTKDCKNLVYTGSVRPSCLPGMLDVLSRVSGATLHFYSPNCVIVPDALFIEKHGKVDRTLALRAQEAADVLVSMGNRGSTFIPAKIFEYISAGKPILHFYYDANDPSLYYFEKYKNCCLVNLNSNPQTSAERIQAFLEQPSLPVTWHELQELFPMNKADYTVDLILSTIWGGADE